MKAIETTYNGALFRSRLEARWAAMFDLLKWSWVYEPFDGDYYIPDFLIEGTSPFLVEVRPCVTLKDYEAQTETIKVPKEVFDGDILILGASATPFFPSAYQWFGNSAGFLFQTEWSVASWFRCLHCNGISLVHHLQSFHGYPCGCYDGDHHLSPVYLPLLKNYWNMAGTQVRWKA